MFAIAAHKAVGQKRKYTGDDYIVHPAEVAHIVDQVPGSTDEMVAAAWLHDVVEDTGVDITEYDPTFAKVYIEEKRKLLETSTLLLRPLRERKHSAAQAHRKTYATGFRCCCSCSALERMGFVAVVPSSPHIKNLRRQPASASQRIKKTSKKCLHCVLFVLVYTQLNNSKE